MRSSRRLDPRPTRTGWLALALWTFLLFALAAAPVSAFPRLPGALPWDKIVHAAEWGLWAGLLFGILVRQYPNWPADRVFLTTATAAAVGGMLHELFQIPIPGRTCDPSDWMADTLGAMGVAFAMTVWFRQARRWLL